MMAKIFGWQLVKTGKKVELVRLKEIRFLRLLAYYFLFLLFGWGCYRLIFRLPETVEEIVLKPIIWLGSLYWVVAKIEKKPLKSLGLVGGNIFRSLYWGIGLGIFFAFEGLLTNYLKYQEFDLPKLSYTPGKFVIAFIVSLATAVSEELVFRGFFFNRLWEYLKKEWSANLIVSVLFILIHLPIAIFVLNYSYYELAIFALILFIYSLGAGFVFARSKQVLASILLHIFWSWPIILFR